MRATEAFKLAREQKAYHQTIELIPYAHFLGITFAETEAGLIFTLPYAQRNIGNPILPALHGGAVAGFMENAAIMHLMWTRASVDVPKNIDFTIDYILPGRPQDTFAICQVARLGRRVANVQIEAWQSNRNSPIAIARSHFKLLTEIEPAI